MKTRNNYPSTSLQSQKQPRCVSSTSHGLKRRHALPGLLSRSSLTTPLGGGPHPHLHRQRTWPRGGGRCAQDPTESAKAETRTQGLVQRPAFSHQATEVKAKHSDAAHWNVKRAYDPHILPLDVDPTNRTAQVSKNRNGSSVRRCS